MASDDRDDQQDHDSKGSSPMKKVQSSPELSQRKLPDNRGFQRSHVHWPENTTGETAMDKGVVVNKRDGLDARPSFFFHEESDAEGEEEDDEDTLGYASGDGARKQSPPAPNSTPVSPAQLESGEKPQIERAARREEARDSATRDQDEGHPRERNYSREAEKLVKSHQKHQFWQRKHHDVSPEEGKITPPRTHGVLSSILKLYHGDSSMSSSTTSMTSLVQKMPRYRSMAERTGEISRQNSEVDVVGMNTQANAKLPPNGIPRNYSEPALSRLPGKSLSPKSAESPSHSGSPSLSPSRRDSSQSLQKMASQFADVKSTIQQASQKLAALPIVPQIEGITHVKKPSHHALSSLMATTANLTGVASVQGSTLAPAPKRPGYKLSRYSLPDAQLQNKSATIKEERESDEEKQAAKEVDQHLSPDAASGNLSPDKARKKPGFWTPTKFFSQSTSGSSTPKKEKDGALRKRKRRQQEIYITMHLADILQRQDFILRMGRALMMFGAPTHRLESQLQFTGRILEIDCQAIYLPGVLIITFGDQDTHTSQTLFIKQASALDLDKLNKVHRVYEQVIKDKIGSGEAITELDKIMKSKPLYQFWQSVLIGGLCSVFITPVSFGGNFVDLLVAFPLGCMLVAIQATIATRNALYSNVFEISVAMFVSFVSRAMAVSGKLCYASITSGSLVLILPGYTVLCGSLELSSKNLVSGSVRLIYAVIYSLFLGFGISIGSSFFQLFDNTTTGLATDCSAIQIADAPWYLHKPTDYLDFLWVIGFSYFLSLRNGARWKSPRTLVMVIFACIGWTANHFVGVRLPNRSDLTSAIGAFVAGLLGSIFSRTRYAAGDAFTTVAVAVLFQVPSGLGTGGGLLQFASTSNTTNATTTFTAGFQVGLSLIEVAIGLTVGLFVATALTHPVSMTLI